MKRLKTYLTDEHGVYKWEWVVLGLLLMIPFISFAYGDLKSIIHYEITEGDQVDITLAPKGFGSENMSRVFMLKLADGIEGVKNAILTAVKDAGPNA